MEILLPQSLQIEVKKNGQVVRKMNVRRKSHYFSGNRDFNLKSSCKQKLLFYVQTNFHDLLLKNNKK